MNLVASSISKASSRFVVHRVTELIALLLLGDFLFLRLGFRFPFHTVVIDVSLVWPKEVFFCIRIVECIFIS